jgi:diaminopimelate decarboxylase
LRAGGIGRGGLGAPDWHFPVTEWTAPDPLPRITEALVGAARRFGTPVQVTDAVELEAAAAAIRAAFPDPWLRAFSVKANDVAGIVARVVALGFDANVVSRGEWAIARRAGLPNDRITLEGVGKTDDDLRAAVRASAEDAPLRWIAIESLDEARALVRIAGRSLRSAELDVMFRLNPEVAPETLRELAVGAAGSKFGMTADELSEAVEVVAGARGLVPRGVQLHVGSQLRAVDAWRDAVRRGLALVALLGGSRPQFDTLDVGGGFPVLPRGEGAPDPGRFARELPALLEAIPADRRPRRLAIEPGRALVARAGYLVARVLHVRERGGRQVVLDTGMAELIPRCTTPGTRSPRSRPSAGRARRRPPSSSRRASRARSASPRTTSASTTCHPCAGATSSRSATPGRTRHRSPRPTTAGRDRPRSSSSGTAG